MFMDKDILESFNPFFLSLLVLPLVYSVQKFCVILKCYTLLSILSEFFQNGIQV